MGVGMQGKAALHDLVNNREVTQVIAADRDLGALQVHVESKGYGAKVQCSHVDAGDPKSIGQLLMQRPDVVIDLLPAPFTARVAAAAVEYEVHFVNASYLVPEVRNLAEEAEAKDLTLLPEFGLDPGIDLVLLGEAVRSLDLVEEVKSYGAGVPEPQAADNPLKYKVAWTFDGALRSYRRAGRIIRDGEVVDIGKTEIFCPENVHEVEIEGVGRLEAFANGDALKYVDLLGINRAELDSAGRYTLRWPGHSAFWRKMVDLHLLDDEPVVVDGLAIDRVRFLAAAIEPHIQYRNDERDVVIVRVEARGRKDGRKKQVVYQVIDRRDLTTGLTAMSRSVGYTASIGALMIANGKIAQRGLLSPVKDVPYDLFARELGKRGIQITSDLVGCE